MQAAFPDTQENKLFDQLTVLRWANYLVFCAEYEYAFLLVPSSSLPQTCTVCQGISMHRGEQEEALSGH